MTARIFLFLLFAFTCLHIAAQKKKSSKNLVYVDKSGVMRWTKNNQEAAFFGINYTTPFAYAYRAHEALGMDHEQAIRNDVYHFARLGFDAFRVHVWDTEITDSAGNLLENEHLRLYDFLIAELKKRGIKIFFTPLAYWGNGYPQRDEKTGSFSSIINNKREVLVSDWAVKSQENYLKQILHHRNPYTGLLYGEDPDIIAIEINNEPHHSGPKEKVTEYVNRMVNAVRSTGWTKPVFYNISESYTYADAVAAADIEGVSFQWYPTGLVANRTHHGNFLPNVSRYRIPFIDTIPAFHDKARMVYEFDAGDVMLPVMYPAMARSFRSAGFQWATHFAYDPLAIAYANTEYQTHFVNLAYTPAKAISLMIAAEAFRELPRNKDFGIYPSDTLFGPFRVSYAEGLSEMNTEEKFLYSGNTSSSPVNPLRLKQISGSGSSPLVKYGGSGAYFLDKIEDDVWRLELMPDAITISDPFARASPQKPVVRIDWNTHPMELRIPGMPADFHIRRIDGNHAFNTRAQDHSFNASPGVYLITVSEAGSGYSMPGQLRFGMREFVAPPPTGSNMMVTHQQPASHVAGQPFTFTAIAAGIGTGVNLRLELRHSTAGWKTVVPHREQHQITAIIPEEMLAPGLLSYRLIIQKADSFRVYPGGHKSDPYAWDNHINETWDLPIVPAEAPVSVFIPEDHRQKLMIYNPDWRNNTVQYSYSALTGNMVQQFSMKDTEKDEIAGWQIFFGDRYGRAATHEIPEFIKIRARSVNGSTKARIAMIDDLGAAYATMITIDTVYKEIMIPLDKLQPDSMLLLPRPYPSFQPLWFKSSYKGKMRVEKLEKFEIIIGYGTDARLELEGVWLL